MIDGMINSFVVIKEDNPLIRELEHKNVYSDSFQKCFF